MSAYGEEGMGEDEPSGGLAEGVVEAKADNGGLKIGGRWFDPTEEMYLTMDAIKKEDIKGRRVVLLLASATPGEKRFMHMKILKDEPKAAQGGADGRSAERRSIERQTCLNDATDMVCALLQSKATLANCGRDELLDLWEEIAERGEKWIAR